MNEFVCATIHSALHKSYVKEVIIDTVSYPIETYKNGCRYVDYDEIRFMVQNVAKSSVFAKKAQEGWQITWGQRPGKWIYMESALLSTSVTVYLEGLPKQNL
jgi:hypothetical protein